MTAEDWLAAKVGEGDPPRLVETMLAAIRATSGECVPDHLAEAALSLFQHVANGSGGREDALPLLAADALLTHAFEAHAELDPQGLAAFVERQSRAERLAALSS